MLRKSLLPALLLAGGQFAWAQDPSVPPLPPVGEGESAVELPLASEPASASADDSLWIAAPPAVPAAPPSPFAGSIWERPKLTGNWLGARDALLESGITIDVSTTQFYQGVTSGGVDESFEYAGRLDYLLNIDGQKAGLMEGSFITLHAETRYGETINGDTGALMPANVGMLFPVPSGTVTALTSVKYTQFLSQSLLVYGGKINTLDELKQPYAAGRGVDAFMNIGLAFPVMLARTVPYSAWGAGFAVLNNLEPVFTFNVFDTKSTPTTTGFEEFFTNGVTMLSVANLPVDLFGLPGHQGIGGSYSTGSYNDLEPTVYFDPTFGLQLQSNQVNGSWALFYLADQALYVDPTNPKRSWGLFGNLGIADNGPSPVRWSSSIGLGGSSPLVSRPLDTFGVGYFYVGYSDPLHDLAPRLLPLRDDQGVEMFYNIAVTPWFRLTPDLQVLVPARERTLPPNARDIDTAVVFGLRAKVDF